MHVRGEPTDALAVARAFTEAVNLREHERAAQLLAEDVVVVMPGGTLQGRDAWLESRRRQGPPEHLAESVEADELSETASGAELTGRLVQRWVESGDVANELPVRISYAVAGGAITRIELHPG